MKKYLCSILCLLGSGIALTSCQSVQEAPAPPPPPAPVYTPGSFEEFVYNHKNYPKTMDIFMDNELMKKATGKTSQVAICLDQQRGRLYVQNKVAADWPVSTGIDGRETPTGSFRVRLKKKDHSSNRYGKLYDAEGKCINRDADAFKDEIPEGGKFVGAGMPNWMRLTSDGVGMHTGKVRAGKRLSHGCIRTPGNIASKLFDITNIGTRVTITQKPEAAYPARTALADRAKKLNDEATAAATAAQKAAKTAEEAAGEPEEANLKAKARLAQKKADEAATIATAATEAFFGVPVHPVPGQSVTYPTQPMVNSTTPAAPTGASDYSSTRNGARIILQP